LADTFDLNRMSSQLSSTNEFGIASSYGSMLHILDHHQGGDIYLFNNGTLVCWGVDQQRQESFLNEYIRNHLEAQDSISKICESTVMAEYTIDEDEYAQIYLYI
jgi:uncharacterized Rmd1/YagE family protein